MSLENEPLKFTVVLPEGFSNDVEVRNIYIINEFLKDMKPEEVKRILDFFKAKYGD